MTTTRYVIFTDMDGTLLDHDTYSHADADDLLLQLQEHGIPVIPNTSKTQAEVLELRKELGLSTPFIVENGAAVFLPPAFLPQKPTGTIWQDNCWVKQLTSRKQHWLNMLDKLKSEYGDDFTHFSAMTLNQICESTGLNEEQAALASRRNFGEPVLWLGDSDTKQSFTEALHKKGAKTLQGGRFLHVGGECDKGSALEWTMSEISNQCPEYTWKSIALGDGQNDAAMLQAADIAIRIRSLHYEPPELQHHEHVITSSQIGPKGWTETLTQLLKPVFEDTQNG